MKIVVVVQARTGSTRLPNKVLMPLAGKPLLLRMLERVQAASSFDELIVATTTDKSDDTIRFLCKEAGVRCYSGHPTDLLDRHYHAAKDCAADAVVKIPSDCPLIDPAVIDKTLNFYKANSEKFDYVGNLHPATYPDGNDVEVMPMNQFERAWREAKKDFEREHTTPFFWEQPERFRIGKVLWETGQDFSMTHRFTIDYKEDYEFISAVFDELYTDVKPVFSLGQILDLLERRKDIYNLNAKYAGVNWYRNHIGELKTVSEKETKKL
jgi:spore coat polysaccharide biosynthesis protein SpsF